MQWCFDNYRIGQFVASHIDDINGVDFQCYSAIGLEKRGTLQCGVVYTDYQPSDGTIQMHIAAINPKWCQRQRLRAFFSYPFHQLGCHRVSAITAADNPKALRLLKGLGFSLEGTVRQGFRRNTDMLIFGMLRHECDWL